MNDCVEVYSIDSKIELTDAVPQHLILETYGWRKGHIISCTGMLPLISFDQQILDDYYYVMFDRELHPDQIEQIYTKSQMRLFKSALPPALSKIHKIEVEVPASLLNWTQNFNKTLPVQE